MHTVTDITPSAATLEQRLDWATQVLDSLPLTVPHRRATLLAAAGVAYKLEVPVTEYAPALMKMNSDELAELANAADLFAALYPNRPVDPMIEEDRIRYLTDMTDVAAEVEADEDLAPSERRHFKALVDQLTRTLEMAPETGSRPIETAAKAVVGDAVVNKRLWTRIARKPWAMKLARVSAALIVLVSAYSSGKELYMDAAAWFGQPSAITAELHPNQTAASNGPGEAEDIHNAETVASDEQEEPQQ